METKPDFISRAQFRGLINTGHIICKVEGEELDVSDLSVKTFTMTSMRDNWGTKFETSPDSDFTYYRGEGKPRFETKIYYQHRQTGEIVHTEPLYWAEAMWYNKFVEVSPNDPTDLSGDYDWKLSMFYPPNTLVFTYNTDWIES